jgi:hypothetical protein
MQHHPILSRCSFEPVYVYVYVAIWHGHMFTAILPGLSTRMLCLVAGTCRHIIDVRIYFIGSSCLADFRVLDCYRNGPAGGSGNGTRLIAELLDSTSMHGTSIGKVPGAKNQESTGSKQQDVQVSYERRYKANEEPTAPVNPASFTNAYAYRTRYPLESAEDALDMLAKICDFTARLPIKQESFTVTHDLTRTLSKGAFAKRDPHESAKQSPSSKREKLYLATAPLTNSLVIVVPALTYPFGRFASLP